MSRSRAELDQFRHALNTPRLDLGRCALLLARLIAYPSLDIEAAVNQLHELAAAAGQRLDPQMSPFERAESVADFLFGPSGQGFRGNAGQYGDPRNSFLNEILKRKLGIPISLSMLYMIVAERHHLVVHGVGLPGHFIVAIIGDSVSQKIWLDPFHGGRRLTRSDCTKLVAQTTGYRGSFLAQWLDPTPPRLILARMLNNLRASYLSRQNWVQAAKTVQLLQIVQPQVPEHIRDEGLIAIQAQDFQRAVTKLERYLEQLPHASDKDAIQKGIAQALDAWVRMN